MVSEGMLEMSDREKEEVKKSVIQVILLDFSMKFPLLEVQGSIEK